MLLIRGNLQLSPHTQVRRARNLDRVGAALGSVPQERRAPLQNATNDRTCRVHCLPDTRATRLAAFTGHRGAMQLCAQWLPCVWTVMGIAETERQRTWWPPDW